MMACCIVASRQIFDFTVAQPHELRLACRGCTAQLHSGHNAPILQARTHGYVCPPRVHLAFLTLVYNNTPAIPDEVLHSRCTSADDRNVLFEEFVATTVLRASHVHSRAFQEILEPALLCLCPASMDALLQAGLSQARHVSKPWSSCSDLFFDRRIALPPCPTCFLSLATRCKKCQVGSASKRHTTSATAVKDGRSASCPRVTL